MKTKIFVLLVCIVVAINSAIIPESQLTVKSAEAKIIQSPKRSQLASLREKVQGCSKGKCSPSDPPAKLKLSEDLKIFVSQEYAKLKNKPTREEIISKSQNLASKSQNLASKAQKPATKEAQRSEKGDNKYTFASRNIENVTPSNEHAKSLIKSFKNADESDSPKRLLESSNNVYQEYDEGNTQANLGSSYIYNVRIDQFGQYNIIGVKTAGTFMSNCLTLIFSSNYYVVEILVSNKILTVIGVVSDFTLVYKISLTATGGVDFSNWVYFYKKGYPVGSREKDNRAIIVTNQDMGTMDYNWYIGGSIPSVIVPANSLSFTSGGYMNAARAVWNIGMSGVLTDYYFEEFLFADWISFISIGNTQNLYIFSHYFLPNESFIIQTIENVKTTPYGASYPSGGQQGYISNALSVDEYYSTLRVIASFWSPVYDIMFYSFAVPTLLAGPPVSVAYSGEYMTSIVYVKELCYISYQTAIKVTTGLDAGTDYPQTNYINSLHKYAANPAIATNYLIGLAYNSGWNWPVVILFKISPAVPLTQIASHQISTTSSFYASSYFWDHQSLLVDWARSSIVFGLYNWNASQPLKNGMYYLKVVLSGSGAPCLTPMPTCMPASPPYAQIYKHWNVVTGVPSQPLTAPGEIPERFTITQSGVNSYLYSSSRCQLQARQLNAWATFPITTVSRYDYCY